jgi:hypothetical protein
MNVLSGRPGSAGDQLVGRVVALWRYPVKAMSPEGLPEVHLSWHGLAGDRRWAFIRAGKASSGFPWLTVRERPDLLTYRPWFTEPDRPDASPTMVRSPAGDEFDVVDPALAAELGDGVRVIKHDRGIFDALPLSLITSQTVTGLGALVGADLDVRRFRPNLVIEAIDPSPFVEEAWVGRVLRVGDARVRVDARDKRCDVVNTDPVTARRDRAVLRAIAQHRQAYLGVYGSTVQPGRVEVGDPVSIET